MARKSKAAKAAASKAGAAGVPWALSPHLYLNPLGNYPNFTFGVLRREFRGRQNSVLEFARLKLHPINLPAPGAPFSPTAARWEVLLPPKAGDEYRDPQFLFSSFDKHPLETRNGILSYITFRFPDVDRLHVAFEKVRAFARAKFVLERQLPLLAVQHAPHLMGSPNPHHVHVLLLPRVLSGLGWGMPNDLLTSDQGQQAVYDEFRASEWDKAG